MEIFFKEGERKGKIANTGDHRLICSTNMTISSNSVEKIFLDVPKQIMNSTDDITFKLNTNDIFCIFVTFPSYMNLVWSSNM